MCSILPLGGQVICYKHKSEHELFLFGSPQFALIDILYLFQVGSKYRIQPWTENIVNQSTVILIANNNKMLALND